MYVRMAYAYKLAYRSLRPYLKPIAEVAYAVSSPKHPRQLTYGNLWTPAAKRLLGLTSVIA